MDPPLGLAQIRIPRAFFRMLDRTTQMAQAKPGLTAKFGSTLFPRRRSGKYHTVKKRSKSSARGICGWRRPRQDSSEPAFLMHVVGWQGISPRRLRSCEGSAEAGYRFREDVYRKSQRGYHTSEF